jgi:hypothetical protein
LRGITARGRRNPHWTGQPRAWFRQRVAEEEARQALPSQRGARLGRAPRSRFALYQAGWGRARARGRTSAASAAASAGTSCGCPAGSSARAAARPSTAPSACRGSGERAYVGRAISRSVRMSPSVRSHEWVSDRSWQWMIRVVSSPGRLWRLRFMSFTSSSPGMNQRRSGDERRGRRRRSPSPRQATPWRRRGGAVAVTTAPSRCVSTPLARQAAATALATPASLQYSA